jgi:4-hydroxy-4-methyl-2-oxoglutarate aldolase
MTSASRGRIGMRAFARIDRPSESDIASLGNASVSDLADAMLGMGVPDSGIVRVGGGARRVVGPALTVVLTPGDGMLVRASIQMAKPGDVLVVNAFGAPNRAVFGGAVAMHMKKRGIRAAIVDGTVRDAAEFDALDFPVFARALSPRSGSSSAGCGEVNVPVAIGGAVVQPGDLVIADGEGVVFVPRRDVAQVAIGLSATGHAPYNPAAIVEGYEALSSDAPLPNIAGLRTAFAQRGGTYIDAAFEQDGHLIDLADLK